MVHHPQHKRSLMTAAFVSAGMHTDINKLDAVIHGLDVGCLEFVGGAVDYVPYIEALFDAAYKITGDFAGIFEYEVCEAFGLWYVNCVNSVDSDWPEHGPALTWIRHQVFAFFDGFMADHDALDTVLMAVPRPAPFPR